MKRRNTSIPFEPVNTEIDISGGMELKKSYVLEHDQEIRIEKSNEDEQAYETIIIDINDNEIIIAAPEKEGVTLPLRPGEEIRVSFMSPRGKYYFKTEVLSRGAWPRPFYVLEKPEKLYRLQRRKYVRIIIIEDIYCRRTDEEGDFTRAILYDLSAGGARFRGYENLEIGAEVELKMDFLPLDNPVKGEIIRARKVPDVGVELAVKFLDMDDDTREDIIKWIFEYIRYRAGEVN